MDHKMSCCILQAGQAASIVMLLLAFVLLRSEDMIYPAMILGMVGTGVLFGALIQARFFYRCPHCGTHFEIRARRPDYCPRCGKGIDW